VNAAIHRLARVDRPSPGSTAASATKLAIAGSSGASSGRISSRSVSGSHSDATDSAISPTRNAP
jgi:hypothetical protein